MEQQIFTFTNLFLVIGFFVTIGVIKATLTERTGRNTEDIKNHETRIATLEIGKAEKTELKEIIRTTERIFDKIESKVSSEDFRDWREVTCKDIAEIKDTIKDINGKIDKYLLNGKE
jgi:hypothetical protein